MRALISVFDKTGVVGFGQKLADAGFELVSTGGTHRTLAEEGGLPVRQVSEVTGSPEILDGRVKTLHPVIHGGILARRDLPAHLGELEEHGIGPIDLVVGNLYPFVDTISKPDVTLEEALENIDIGGPTMLRAAAKNFPSVAVVVDPADYDWVADRLAGEGLTDQERRGLAAKAFQHVAQYDATVAGYLTESADAEQSLPETLNLSFRQVATLRYGENPHQQGSLYVPTAGVGGGISAARQLHGRELSYNNLMDADAAWRTVSDFPEPAVAVIKHANPCGLSSHEDLAQAYLQAYEGDTVSAFGGIVGFNRTVTAAAAEAMNPVFYEVVVAPGYESGALEVLQRKRNLRVLAVAPGGSELAGISLDLRPITGGVLVQTPDALEESPAEWKTATDRVPTEAEMDDLAFAWVACKHIKSNAIVFAKDRTLVGMGAGQPNRVVSVHLSQRIAGGKGPGLRPGVRCLFPLPGQHRTGRRSGSDGHNSARRFHTG